MAKPKFDKTQLVLDQTSKQLIDKIIDGILTQKGINYAAGLAADEIRDEAKRVVPVDTGTLRDSIISRTYKPGTRRSKAAKVDIDYKVIVERKGENARAYPYLVEFGHGGDRKAAEGFMRKAARGKRNEVKVLFVNTIKKQIDKELGR